MTDAGILIAEADEAVRTLVSERARLAVGLACRRHAARGARLVLHETCLARLARLDLERLAEARRPPLAERHGVYYTKPAVLDAYEVLRQMIDQTDQLRSTLVLAELPPALVLDEVRGLPAYAALELRVADEVRDRRRANPFASLVRLETRLEAVP